MAANPQDVQSQSNLAAEVLAIIGRLEREADDRVGKRDPIEKRWLEDLRQFHGQYDEKISRELKEAEKSNVFLNQTRPKTNAMEARLSDMLFPTDDKNWGISPTPVPELTVQAEQVAREAARAGEQLAANPEDPAAQDRAARASEELKLVDARMEEARTRARSMEAEIDDQLVECDYPAQARKIIRDGCKIGTGVIKGPVTDGHRRSWKQNPAEPGLYELVTEKDEKPSYWRVDPWNFFPDPDATCMQESTDNFERHLMNERQLRRLAKRPGFNKNAIRQLLNEKPTTAVPSFYQDLRSITDSFTDMTGNRYHVWEYHGAVTAGEMKTIAMAAGRPEFLEDLDESDPLDELNVVLWFCQGKLLKIGIHSLDSGDPIYSVFNLEKDEASIFGFGVPYLMRDSQKSVGAAWRTVLDNMGLASGPQIVINEDVVEPLDGKWILTPRKLWRRKSTAHPDKKPFETFNIESHLSELLELVEYCKKNIDEDTALPIIAQGDQSTTITKTAGGMSMLMNSVNIVFRRVVKNWDDDVTEGVITRAYDHNMQFSKKDYIKGDYQVDARGTSVLLVREMQSANLLSFLLHFAGHPVLGKYLKKEGLPSLRRLAQVLMLPQDEVVKTDDDVAKDEAKAASQPPPSDPEMEKIVMQGNTARMANDTQMRVAYLERDTAMMELASKGNMKLDELRAMLADHDKEREHKERIFAAEAAIEASQPKDDKGSGGYIS